MKRILALISLLIVLAAWVVPTDVLAQRRGGSFGGSRGGRSFGRSTRGAPRSFGGTRTQPGSKAPSQPGAGFRSSSSKNSFGGSRLSRSTDYTSRYGVPRRTETRTFTGANGTRSNYVINQYGGMGDGFMMGYMLGAVPWYWSMPFHPAFYYSRPYAVVNSDGSTGVYPGTFQWGALILSLFVIAAIGYIVYVWIRNKRRRLNFASAYNSNDDARKSSFM